MAADRAPAAQPRFSRLDPDERRAQILGAARRLFAAKPFANVSSGEIAREAGVTRALVHHYYGGKRELYIAVLKLLADESAAAIRTDRDLPPEQMVAANVDAWLDFMSANRELGSAIAGVGPLADDPAVSAVVEGLRDAVVDRILVNHTGTTDHPGPVRLLVRSYLGLAEAAAREWLQHQRATRAQAHILLTTSLLAIMRDALPALLAADDPA